MIDLLRLSPAISNLSAVISEILPQEILAVRQRTSLLKPCHTAQNVCASQFADKVRMHAGLDVFSHRGRVNVRSDCQTAVANVRKT